MNNTMVLTAGDIMQKKVICLHPKDKMSSVKAIFDEYAIHHIPICVSEQVVGIISRSDFIKFEGLSMDSYDAFIKGKVMKTKAVEEFMIHEVVCCHKSAPLVNVIDLFLANEVHSVLVVNKTVLLGIITPSDLLRLLKEKL